METSTKVFIGIAIVATLSIGAFFYMSKKNSLDGFSATLSVADGKLSYVVSKNGKYESTGSISSYQIEKYTEGKNEMYSAMQFAVFVVRNGSSYYILIEGRDGAVLAKSNVLVNPAVKDKTVSAEKRPSIIISLAEADKINAEVQDYIKKQNEKFGGMTKYSSDIANSMLKPLFDNGYAVVDGKVVKKII